MDYVKSLEERNEELTNLLNETIKSLELVKEENSSLRDKLRKYGRASLFSRFKNLFSRIDSDAVFNYLMIFFVLAAMLGIIIAPICGYIIGTRNAEIARMKNEMLINVYDKDVTKMNKDIEKLMLKDGVILLNGQLLLSNGLASDRDESYYIQTLHREKIRKYSIDTR